MSVFRKDAGSLGKPKQLPGGRVIYDAHISRSGVFEYLRADGTVQREYRPPEEVFSDASLESFALAPLTLGHPSEAVRADNAEQYAVGAVSEVVWQDGDHVRARLVATSQRALAAIALGVHELSCGYTCELEFKPGVTPAGEHYDAIQRNIVGNHVALVEKGRAGTARLRADGNEIFCDTITPQEKGDQVTLEELQAQVAALSAKISSLEAARDAAQAQATTEGARADALEAAIPQRVQARIELLDIAKAAGVEKLDGSDADLQLAVVANTLKLNVSDERRKDLAYVAGLFEAAKSQIAARAVDKTREAFAKKADEAPAVKDYSTLEAEAHARARAAWKGNK